ncbi:hypothetical protein SK128_016890 [Halocaridina rubra]|uniref:L-seryl-tRNA(Sec) kinase n=1 Tax=Halocaridina rubra TaxID=373956 RepID=A0AAN8XT86_HALRR
MESNITLVLVVGLPGAGKSTFCKNILSQKYVNIKSVEYHIIYVCFDTLIPLSTQRQYAEARINGNEDIMDCWKGARHEILINVDKLISSLKSGVCDDHACNMFNLDSETIGKNKLMSYLIVLDDNFYYRSMRYEYFQLARKHTVGFMQVYIECSTDTAIKQNTKRGENQLPTSVIVNMAQKFQSPKPHENEWEYSTCIMSLDNFGDLKEFWEMLHACMMSPVQPLEDNEQERENSRLICSQSVSHQIDLYLRSLVGKNIKEARANGILKGTELSTISSRVNGARQTLLDAVKKGVLLFPARIAETIDDNNRDLFQNFIEAEFQKLM